MCETDFFCLRGVSHACAYLGLGVAKLFGIFIHYSLLSKIVSATLSLFRVVRRADHLRGGAVRRQVGVASKERRVARVHERDLRIRAGELLEYETSARPTVSYLCLFVICLCENYLIYMRKEFT